MTTRAGIDAVKGTAKAAVLEGVPDIMVHFLSMCCTETKWMEKTRKTWDKEISCMRLGRFLRLVINDSYNMNMNNVDVSDQLRGSYLPDRWMSK